MKSCGCEDCFNCPYSDCIVDMDENLEDFESEAEILKGLSGEERKKARNRIYSKRHYKENIEYYKKYREEHHEKYLAYKREWNRVHRAEENAKMRDRKRLEREKARLEKC